VKTQVRRILRWVCLGFVGLLALDGTMLEVNRTALEAASPGTPADVVGKSFPDTIGGLTIQRFRPQLSKDIYDKQASVRKQFR